MDIDQKLANALYAKLAGLSFDRDIIAEDGSILIPCNGPVRKSQIVRAVRNGESTLLIDLLMVDPAQIGRMRTKRVRDGLDDLAQSHQKDGAHLARSISELLRTNDAE